MAMSINTNVVSINAQRNLGLSGGSLAQSMQRLSSGLRVNSAKDDAAGLAIAERMNTQVKGLAVASRNANDGISLAQTAEGALGKVGDMLQRMRELAVQSSNATNSKSDREALQAELTQLRDEVDRVAKTTSFNGAKLLDGSFTGAVFQVGANSGDNITVGALANTKVAELGNANYTKAASTTLNTANLVNGATSMSGADTTITIVGALGAAQTATVDIAKDANMTGDEALGKIVAAINSKSADTGVTAFLNDAKTGIELRATMDGDTANATAVSVTSTNAGFTAGLVFAASAAPSADDLKGIDGVDITTQAGAWEALQHIDSALDKVNSARGELGAIQARFEKTVENIDIQNENLSAARGRIVDADFAQETANLSRTQILQQAGTAMVAQANQLPQNVLSLLR
ncbi:flagellin [Comamonas aquatica]|uniref:flagellin n=1 Tax=Comamonas aquatica TaxID=225991 RepID=UPI00244A4C59|nr:flagellin [Comamonas aquatica]MDH0382983.1 flagellin [Comamonas aquatica]MDH0431042.1 flagellin [Comamonas aquatica]MDH0942092.1 flagellin [Comamonas aquatica]MDH1674361.1 flagellin [Comamonas aquatica]MDH1677913.1 flagellin [Comamonas aquatica]